MGVWCKGVYEYVWVYVPNQMASKGFHLVFVYPSVCVYPYVSIKDVWVYVPVPWYLMALTLCLCTPMSVFTRISPCTPMSERGL